MQPLMLASGYTLPQLTKRPPLEKQLNAQSAVDAVDADDVPWGKRTAEKLRTGSGLEVWGSSKSLSLALRRSVPTSLPRLSS